jgi:hypothetical protein
MRSAIGSMLLFFTCCSCKTWSQELFVYTEPASNMPARSIGVRLSNWFMDESPTDRVNYHFVPEVMWGANKYLMLHVEGYFSNRSEKFNMEGGALYAKYRFFSNDKVYRHLRLAAFGRVSTNNGDIHQEEIQINGHNSGIELGLIGTQLLHKLALSTTVSYQHAMNNGNGNEYPATLSDNALNYSLSIGRLILPKNYTNYKQTNVNLMAEFLGQNLLNNKMYMDIATSVQFIINSQTRVDIGYKKELYSNMLRTAPNGFLIRIEHLFFNAL